MQLREYVADDTEAVETGRVIINATRAFETPWLPAVSAHRREMQVRHGWDGPPDRHFLASSTACPSAVAQSRSGEWDNRDLAWLRLVVHPECRGRGHGSALLERPDAAWVAARDAPRSAAAGWELPGVEAFARRHGFDARVPEVNRVQYPLELPPGLADAAYDEAAAVRDRLRAGPDRRPHTGATSCRRSSRSRTAINDAPSDDLDIEDEVFTAERVQAYETRHDRVRPPALPRGGPAPADRSSSPGTRSWRSTPRGRSWPTSTTPRCCGSTEVIGWGCCSRPR